MIHLTNAGRSIILAQRLIEISAFLSGKNIQVIALKGPVLAERAYGEMTSRSFVDLDILVRGKDFSDLYGELTKIGYKAALPLSEGVRHKWARFGREFVFTGDGVIIDVHMRISEGPAFFSAKDSIWADSVKIVLNSHQVRALSAEDSLIFLTIHGAKHCWQLLKGVMDVAHLVASQPGIDWEKVEFKARQIGCLTMLCIGLALSRDLCGLDLPSDFEDRLFRSTRIKKYVKQFKEQIILSEQRIKRFKRRILPLILMDSLSKKIKYILYYTFIPKFTDLKKVRLPSFLYFLYLFIRPVRLFFNICLELFKVLFKR
jgi:hypothetical protein